MTASIKGFVIEIESEEHSRNHNYSVKRMYIREMQTGERVGPLPCPDGVEIGDVVSAYTCIIPSCVRQIETGARQIERGEV